MTVFTKLSVKRNPALLAWASLAICIALLLAGIDRGFDLSDESFYILWIADPGAYQATIHPFGYLLNPFFEGFGRSLIAMRGAGIAALLASGATAGLTLARYYRDKLALEDRQALPVLGALASLSFYALWILTPSYNLLTNVGAMLAFAGCLGWADKDRGEHSVIGWGPTLLVAGGGFVSFMAKPTFAVIVAVAVTGILAVAARRNARIAALRFLAAAAACAGLLFVTLAFTVGVAGFVSAIHQGLAVLNFGNTPKALLVKTAGDFYYSSPVLWMEATFAAVALVLCQGGPRPAPRAIRYMAVAMLGLAIAFLAWNVGHGMWMREIPGPFVGLPMICLALPVIALAALRSPDPLRIADLLPVLVLLVFPFAAGIGSAISIMTQTLEYIWAPLMAGIIATCILGAGRYRLCVERAIIVAMPLLLVWSALAPFRLVHSLPRQTEPIHLAAISDTLKVDPETAALVRHLQQVAAVEKLTPDTPVIDLAGAGPGMAVVLGGHAPFYPWLVPFYGDPIPTLDALWTSLGEAQKRQAWILGPTDKAFTSSALAKDFASHRDRYRKAGELQFLYWGKDPRSIEIWKPL